MPCISLWLAPPFRRELRGDCDQYADAIEHQREIPIHRRKKRTHRFRLPALHRGWLCLRPSLRPMHRRSPPRHLASLFGSTQLARPSNARAT